jgi:hypothetical protein
MLHQHFVDCSGSAEKRSIQCRVVDEISQNNLFFREFFLNFVKMLSRKIYKISHFREIFAKEFSSLLDEATKFYADW